MEKNIHGLWIVSFMKWSRKRLIALIAYIAYSIAKIKWSIAIIKFMIPRFGNESHENDHTLLWQNFHKDVQCSNKIQQPTTVMIQGSLQCRANSASTILITLYILLKYMVFYFVQRHDQLGAFCPFSSFFQCTCALIAVRL